MSATGSSESVSCPPTPPVWDAPTRAFSLNLLYDRAMVARRLFGMVHDGGWHHVATPEGLAEAETWINP